MPLTINGVRNQIFPAPVATINGEKFAHINGIHEARPNKQRMVWNGHRFMPPDPGSVLHLPGYPGFGSTIFDFSMIPVDSAINTNEELDATETGIDCDADATTAIPIGTEIRIDSEWMKVTATGVTLTVIRGFNASIPATHVTNSDIWKMRAANHGAITGATWVRLPSGLWYLNFDGDDLVTVAHNANLNIGAGDLTLLGWASTSVAGGLIGKTATAGESATAGYYLQIRTNDPYLRFGVGDGVTLLATAAGGVATDPRDGKYHFFAATYNGTTKTMTTYLDTVLQKADTQALLGSVTNTEPVLFGKLVFSGPINSFLTGKVGLWRAFSSVLTTGVMSQIYNQERHLFGV